MSCQLKHSTTANEDFIGQTGAAVTLRLDGPADIGAEIVHIRYAGDPIDADQPFQFTIQKGSNILVVLAEASQAGALLQLVEECGGGQEQVLDRFHFDPKNPGRGYIVTGL